MTLKRLAQHNDS